MTTVTPAAGWMTLDWLLSSSGMSFEPTEKKKNKTKKNRQVTQGLTFSDLSATVAGTAGVTT